MVRKMQWERCNGEKDEMVWKKIIKRNDEKSGEKRRHEI